MPLLSGFLPIPLAMMIPFMGAQSLIIGKQFGEGFQYGKRKISAMTNEEFNKLTPQKIAHDSAKELNEMIPEMKASITDMRHFQSFIVNELIATAKQLPQDIFGEGTEGRGIVEGQFGLRGALGISDEGAIADIRNYYENQISTETGTGRAAATSQVSQSGRNFSYLRTVTLGSLQTQQVRRRGTDIQLEQAIFREIQRRIAADPNIINPPPPPPPPDTQQVIQDTSTGDVRRIAAMYNGLVTLLATAQRLINRPSSRAAQNESQMRALKRRFMSAARTYNQFVQQLRRANLTIDTQKSWDQKKIITR